MNHAQRPEKGSPEGKSPLAGISGVSPDSNIPQGYLELPSQGVWGLVHFTAVACLKPFCLLDYCSVVFI